MNGSGKDSFWQFVRGLCIVAVVLIHCSPGIGRSDVSFLTWFTLRQVINFPVATFVFMAGYFVSRRKIEIDATSYMAGRGATSSSVCLVEPALFRRVVRRVCIEA